MILNHQAILNPGTHIGIVLRFATVESRGSNLQLRTAYVNLFTLHDIVVREVVNFHKPRRPSYRKCALCPAVISSNGC